MGRLALVADELSQQLPEVAEQLQSSAQRLRTNLRRHIEPWLAGTASDALCYDVTWGGLVPRKALTDAGYAYGSGLYNDHHFHYGKHACACLIFGHCLFYQ
jgi:endo-1,3(4)-beta-glucanase